MASMSTSQSALQSAPGFLSPTTLVFPMLTPTVAAAGTGFVDELLRGMARVSVILPLATLFAVAILALAAYSFLYA